MCGISGIVSRSEITWDTAAHTGAMSKSLTHRGPDGAGEHHDTHISLASRRLSIIDLEGGHQPLYNEDRSLALIINGEIYNHNELRRSLKILGHRFSTRNDCETILHLYEEFGPDCVKHLRGMFAFALWDAAHKRLVLARDRMGEKPLYLYESEGQLIFASEMKALLASGLVPFELDAEAINLYFHYQYVPEPLTPLKGVRKLDAARLLIVDVEGWQIQETCYWRAEDAPMLEGDAGRLIREQLEEVGELIVGADVSVGVALSGGLDSSAVAAFASRHYPGKLSAFSVGYSDEPETDERADARALAQHLKLPFHEVELRTDEVADFFPELIYWRDDPIADIAGHGYYAVMKLAREHDVPVILQGQGGDELFWGYPLLQQAAQESLQKSALQNGGLRNSLRYLSFNSPEGLSGRELSGWARDLGGLRSGWRRLQTHRAAPLDRMVFYDLSPDFQKASGEARGLYGKQFIEQLGAGDATTLFTFNRPWPRVDVALTNLISATYLRENGITQGDRLSMASSVEMRLPLLDYKLVETIIGLRKSQSDVNLPAKSWLRQAAKGILPEWVLNRPKRGFAPPVMKWHEALFTAYGDSLRDGYLVQCGVLNEASAECLASGAFPAGATCPLSFKALVLEQWCRRMSAVQATSWHRPSSAQAKPENTKANFA
jgi:asparagine synthase (glutamine-hydrolysing)